MKSTRINTFTAFGCQIALLICVAPLLGASSDSLISELSSSSQQTRDAAAKILRETYSIPPITHWEPLIASLSLGSAKTNVVRQLSSLKLQTEGGVGSGTTETIVYRLDEAWILECSFTNSISNGRLSRRSLAQRIRDIWVEPPRNFSGAWTTYYANGQASHQFQYIDGHPEGKIVTFRPDGTVSVVSHMTNNVAEGQDEGFYPSGHTAYRGQYRGGTQVGTWIWYNEDGSVKSRKEFPKRQDDN